MAAQTSKRRTRRKHSDAYKRKLVREALKPGASTKKVGEKHGVNPNMISRWKKDPDLRPPTTGIPTRPRRRPNGKAGRTVPAPSNGGQSRLDLLEGRIRALEEQIYGASPQ